MVADEQLINNISSVLEEYVENCAAVLKLLVADQLYIMQHRFGSYHCVNISHTTVDFVEVFFVDHDEVHSVNIPRIYELPRHYKWIPIRDAHCSMKCEEWTPEARDHFMQIASGYVTVFHAAFDAFNEDGKFRISLLCSDNMNLHENNFLYPIMEKVGLNPYFCLENDSLY